MAMTGPAALLAAAHACAARSCGGHPSRCECEIEDLPELDEAVEEWLAETGLPSAAWEPPEVGCYWLHAARVWRERAEALAGLILARAGGAVRDGWPRPTPEDLRSAWAVLRAGGAPLAPHCQRCGHQWVRRRPDQPPRSCPRCHSPYWDRPRTRRPNPRS